MLVALAEWCDQDVRFLNFKMRVARGQKANRLSTWYFIRKSGKGEKAKSLSLCDLRRRARF